MSKEIDWSKAPEGATHWVGGSEPWHKHINGVSWYWQERESKWRHLSIPAEQVEDEYRATIVERQPESWTGTGLPPVGTVCETERNEFFRRVEILYIGVERVFVRDENGEEIALLLDGRQFFPVRTKEQIEADEREKAVQEMQDIVNSTPVAYRVGLYALYDAGYRKTEAGK